MERPGSFIITLEYKTVNIDIELSSENTLEELRPYISKSLLMASGGLLLLSSYDLYVGNRRLIDERTPSELGLFDGTIIKIVPR